MRVRDGEFKKTERKKVNGRVVVVVVGDEGAH